jgi:hypothetical protein
LEVWEWSCAEVVAHDEEETCTVDLAIRSARIHEREKEETVCGRVIYVLCAFSEQAWVDFGDGLEEAHFPNLIHAELALSEVRDEDIRWREVGDVL